MTNQQQSSFLKAEQVAEILNISRSLAYRLMQDGEIPTISIGKTKRVRQDDLDDYINNKLIRIIP